MSAMAGEPDLTASVNVAEKSPVTPPLVAERAKGEPDWLEPSFRITPGADPLGLQTVTTDRIIPRVLPGILALSERARYISFYAWLLGRYADQRRSATYEQLSHYVKTHEFELAIAVRLCPRGCGSSPIGANRAGWGFVGSHDPYPRDESVKSSMGGYGLYYATPMREFGLTAAAGTSLGGDPIPIDVLRRDDDHAVAVEKAFAAAVGETRYVRDHMDGSEPIPRDVLVEYAEKACLCRLGEHPDEQVALRAALFEPSPHQRPDDVRLRREGFALFLSLAGTERWTDYDDSQLRRSLWREFWRLQPPGTVRGRVLARWAALAAANFMHEAITHLWRDCGPRLRRAAPPEGLTREAMRVLLREMAVGEVTLPDGTRLTGSPGETTGDVIARIHVGLGSDADLTVLRDTVRSDHTTFSGTVLLLALLTHLPDPEAVDSAWGQIAAIDGEWQPGPLRLRRRLDVHLESTPTLGDTVQWLCETLVIRTHELIAGSKLPDFTFRFRWEAGRLRFYDHDFNWVGPGHIRSWTMGQLSRDLGFCELAEDGCRLTSDGEAFVAEVFG
jgi:hypothetical protein